MTWLVCSITAEASEAKKYSTCLSSKGSNSEVDPVLGNVWKSGFPCGRYSTILTDVRKYLKSSCH